MVLTFVKHNVAFLSSVYAIAAIIVIVGVNSYTITNPHQTSSTLATSARYGSAFNNVMRHRSSRRQRSSSTTTTSQLHVLSTTSPPSRQTKWGGDDDDNDDFDDEVAADYYNDGENYYRLATRDKSNALDGSDYLLQTEDYSILKTDLEAEHMMLQQQESAKHLESLDNDSTIDNNSNNFQLNLPQIHIPARIASPGIGWQHHHRATVNLVHRYRGLIDETDDEIITVSTAADSKQQLKLVAQDANETNKQPNVKEASPVVESNLSIKEERPDNQQKQSAAQQLQLQSQSQATNENPVARMWSMIRPNRPQLVSTCSEWKRLQKHAEHMQTLHLSDFLKDEKRCNAMYATHDGVYLDYSRQRVNMDTMKFLYDLAKKQDLKGRIKSMVTGEKINFTEERAVLHTALRADRSEIGTIIVDEMDVVKEVHEVLDQIKQFTNDVRSGTIRGYTGKRLRNIVSVGIGGSYLGPEFLHECLKTEPEGINAALGYNLRFLSNVDPVDVERTVADLDPEETLIVVVSKTFTTAETMLNARTMRQWLWDFMGRDKEVVRKHMVACASTSATKQVADFGIDTDTGLFRFWDFIGGRYSVCSAAGAVPISLLYSFEVFEKFLKGANSIDKHFVSAPFEKNIPVLMGLLGVWNMSFLKHKARVCLPYAEALLKLPAHIQQLDMESNGKSMTRHGLEVDYPVGEIDFGEAGTNGQHSFYQLLHMGQTVPCDFIGFIQSQHDFCLDGESLSSHDELMANFFAQPDALANGKTAEEVRAEGVPEHLIGHRVFEGNRPSLSLLLPKLTAYACGQLLAIYEHRTAVQGFMWDINSFDQWGVELGKKLAIEVKEHMINARNNVGDEEFQVTASNPATTRLLNYYLRNSIDSACCEGVKDEGNEFTAVTRKTHKDHQNAPFLNDLDGFLELLS